MDQPIPCLRLALLGTLLALPLAGCAASGAADRETEPYVPLPDPEPDSIGFFLTEFDASLRAWTNLTLAGSSDKERRMRRGLEREMGQRARKRQDELVAELQSGPPKNRAVAAVALGFTGDPSVMSPIYAALEDVDDDVVHNALLGLGHLRSPDTPLAELCYLLRNDPDPWVRNNAAFALSSVIGAGGKPTPLSKRSCREALNDEEPGVRAQCATILGLTEEAAAVDELGDLLYDEVELVSAAAAASLAAIGKQEPTRKGAVARHLADALDRVPSARRPFLLAELIELSDLHHGDEAEAWQDWARRLP